MEIITNHHWNNFLYGYELPESARADFDYIDAAEFDSHNFIRYRGYFYDPAEFMRVPVAYQGAAEFQDWHGYHADSYFSGVLIRISDDGEQYQIATYIA